MAKANRTIFLQNVSQLEITIASPKHPQSLTGFAIARYNVSGVIKHIVSNMSFELHLGNRPNKTTIPNAISNPQRKKDIGIS